MAIVAPAASLPPHGARHRLPDRAIPRLTASFPTLLLGLCLVYLMIRPVSSNAILFPVLGVLGATSVALIVARRRRAARELLPTAAFLGAATLLGLTVGLDNPGWLHSLLPWVAGPLVFGALALATDERTLPVLLHASAWATLALSGFIVVYVGGEAGWFPAVLPAVLLEQTGAGFDGSGDATAIRLYGLSTLAAAAPMWAASLLVGRHAWLPGPLLRVAAMVSSAAAVMLGGRRAIILIVLITPAVVWILGAVLRRGSPRTPPLPVVICGLLAAPFVVAAAPLVATRPEIVRATAALAAFFSPERGAMGIAVRADQGRYLLDEAAASPLVGRGFGAVLERAFVRNAERPWEFELQYHLMAFQLGAIGCLLLALAALGVLQAMRRAALARPEDVPVLIVTGAAAIGMLIANSSNPYLQAPGHMWALALVVGATNVLLVDRGGSPVGARPRGSDDAGRTAELQASSASIQRTRGRLRARRERQGGSDAAGIPGRR